MRSNAELKYEARRVIRKNPRLVYLTAGLVILAALLVNFLYARLLGTDVWLMRCMEVMEAGGTQLPAPPQPSGINLLLAVLVNLAGASVELGFSAWCLRRARGEEVGLGELFPDFGVILKGLFLRILTGGLVVMGLMLFVVPGLYLMYRWRLALYVLFDHPEETVLGCMRRSAELMGGRMLSLFSLELSFLGWELLAVLLSSLYFPVVDIWLRPYLELSHAVFYLHALEGENPDANQNP